MSRRRPPTKGPPRHTTDLFCPGNSNLLRASLPLLLSAFFVSFFLVGFVRAGIAHTGRRTKSMLTTLTASQTTKQTGRTEVTKNTVPSLWETRAGSGGVEPLLGAATGDCLLVTDTDKTQPSHPAPLSASLASITPANFSQLLTLLSLETSQQTQNICITFVKCRTNAGPTLYKCYTNVLCLLGCLIGMEA